MSNDQLSYWLALSSVNGLGPLRFKLLLQYFKTPKNVWLASEKELKELGLPKNVVDGILKDRESVDLANLLDNLGKAGITALTLADKEYPRFLKEIADPPPVLYCRGEIKEEDELAIAVVGTRKITSYGREVTENLTTSLVSAGLTIVSGLARGVDSCAHKVALATGGRTIAVLGSGPDNIYPPENKKLAEDIISGHGAVISEFPPGTPATPGNFPSRNRIISGLSLGVLVTEAAQDSGSLITANCALEQNREVFAVPGPITSSLSQGPASLIKVGAKLVYRVEDILEELNLQEKFKQQEARKIIPENKEEEVILRILENEEKHVDEIVRESGLPSGQVGSLLTMMEISGKIKNLGRGKYRTGT